MKDKIFHFFGNIIEQSPIPTPIKLFIAVRLDLILFFLTHFFIGVLRTPAEYRISEDFMKYIYKNHIDENPQKLDVLKRGLDDDSKSLMDNIVKRQKHMYTHNVYNSGLLTDDEKADRHIYIYPIKRKYRGFGNYYGIENFYFHCGLRFLSKNLLRMYKEKDVIDAGASNGDTPAIFSREYVFGNIYAFEPENNNYEKLLKNIKRFRLDNVIPVKKGLGDRRRKLRITNEEGQSHISSIGDQEIDIVTIDEFVEKNNISVGLIKMDIEGFEFYAVQGALRTIKKQHPILLISIYHSGKDFFEIKPLLEKIGGYKFIVRKLNPHSLFFDTMLIGSPI